MSALLFREHCPGPFLVIAPVSTISAWLEALQTWIPAARVLLLDGDKEDREVVCDTFYQDDVLSFHILITSPDIALKEQRNLMDIKWRLLCIDEAHQLKNEKSQRNSVFKQLVCDAILLMTATPLHNSLSELCNLLSFIEPKLEKKLQYLCEQFSITDFGKALQQCHLTSL